MARPPRIEIAGRLVRGFNGSIALKDRKRFLVVFSGLTIVLLAAISFLLFRSPLPPEARGFQVSFVGFTNRAFADQLLPHAVFLMHEPESLGNNPGHGHSWGLYQVCYQDTTGWKIWLPRDGKSPQPHEE